jgi:tripartite-type tricarboxylate transporter receptor subunit TctC
LRALAVTSAKRHPLLPDVPSVVEAGYKNSVSTTWYGLVAPANTPKPIIDKLSKTVAAALAAPEAQAAFGKLGLDPATSTPEETRAFIVKDLAKWKTVVTNAGIRIK